jgi:hypothetical protein
MMEVNTSVNGKTARGMGKALGLSPVEVSTSVDGRMDREMGKAPSHFPMEGDTSVNTSTVAVGREKNTTRTVMSSSLFQRVLRNVPGNMSVK